MDFLGGQPPKFNYSLKIHYRRQLVRLGYTSCHSEGQYLILRGHYCGWDVSSIKLSNRNVSMTKANLKLELALPGDERWNTRGGKLNLLNLLCGWTAISCAARFAVWSFAAASLCPDIRFEHLDRRFVSVLRLRSLGRAICAPHSNHANSRY